MNKKGRLIFLTKLSLLIILPLLVFSIKYFPSEYIDLLYEDMDGKVIKHGEPISINTPYFVYIDESSVIKRGEIFSYFFTKFFKSGFYEVSFKNNSSLLSDDNRILGEIKLDLVVDEKQISLNPKEWKKIDDWKIGEKHKFNISKITFYDINMKHKEEGNLRISNAFKAKKAYSDFIFKLIIVLIAWSAALSSIIWGIKWIKNHKWII